MTITLDNQTFPVKAVATMRKHVAAITNTAGATTAITLPGPEYTTLTAFYPGSYEAVPVPVSILRASTAGATTSTVVATGLVYAR